MTRKLGSFWSFSYSDIFITLFTFKITWYGVTIKLRLTKSVLFCTSSYILVGICCSGRALLIPQMKLTIVWTIDVNAYFTQPLHCY